MDAIYREVTKKSRLGAPEELNYAAMIISTFVRYIERVPTVKDLITRLHDDIAFKLNCGFLVSDDIPSEASYSRLVTKLKECNILEKEQEKVVLQAIAEGFIMDDTVSIDATHFEASDQAPRKEEKPKPEPKKRGCKSKEEPVERANSYLKEFFQLNNVRYRTGERAKIHFDMVTLV